MINDRTRSKTLPHLPLLVLGDEVAVEVLQGHFGHGDPLLGVVAHGGARALAGHRHALSEGSGQTARHVLSMLG